VRSGDGPHTTESDTFRRSGRPDVTDREAERAAREWWDAWAEQFQEEYGGGDHPVVVDWGPGAPAGDDLGLLGDVDGAEVVELGCGAGQFGLALAGRGATLTGVDVSREQLRYAREAAAELGADARFLQATVTGVPLPDDAFDLAVSSWAFQWVPDLDAALAEAHRVLRPGGRLAFSVDHPFYKARFPGDREEPRSYFAEAPERMGGADADAAL
jgi:SAM-dependent methyltransferase